MLPLRELQSRSQCRADVRQREADLVCQGGRGAADEDLVGQGVKIRADHGPLLVPAGHEAVEPVAGPCRRC